MKKHMLPPQYLAVSVLGFVLVGAGTAHAASTVAAIWSYQTTSVYNDTAAYNIGVFDSGDFSNHYDSFDKSTTASKISVSASEGEIHLYNQFESPGGYNPNNQGGGHRIQARVGGGFEDTITITDSARTGQAGTYTGSIRINLAQQSFGIAQEEFRVGVGSTMGNARGVAYDYAFTTGNSSSYARVASADPVVSMDQIINFTVPIVFGQSFGIAVWTESYFYTKGYIQSASFGEHDASHTVNWAGTVLVEDSTGTDLDPESYSLASGSGTNYVSAVPEPTSMLLFGLGVVAVSLRRERRC